MMLGILRTLILTELLIVLFVNHVSSHCPGGRINVANAGELKVVDIYFKLDSMLCSGKPVYKCESKPNARFLYWDTTLNNWALSDKFCDPGTDQQVLKSSSNTAAYPDEVAQWWERYPKGYFMNPYITMTCVTEVVPFTYGGAAPAVCGTHEFLLSKVTNTNLDVDGHYIRDTGAPCFGTGTRPVYTRVVPATPARYMYYVPGPPASPGLWAVGPNRCDVTGDDMYLQTYSAARDWEYTKKYYWEEQPNKGQNRHETNAAITFFCLPTGCYEWGPWQSLGGACEQQDCKLAWPTGTECLSPCGGCGTTLSTRDCIVGTMTPPAVQGTTDVPTLAPCNVGVICDSSTFSHKYQFIKEKWTESHIHALAYGARYCCFDHAGTPLSPAKPCYEL